MTTYVKTHATRMRACTGLINELADDHKLHRLPDDLLMSLVTCDANVMYLRTGGGQTSSALTYRLATDAKR